MNYIFMPELVGLGARNLSGWLEDNQLLVRKGPSLPDWLVRVLDVEKALKLEKDLRKEIGPTLCFTMDEMIADSEWNRLVEDVNIPKKLLQNILDEHYDLAKATDKFYEFISEPFVPNYCIRLIGIKFKSGFWKGWTEVTVQICKTYMKKWKGELKKRSRVLSLGFHVERADGKLLTKYLVQRRESVSAR